MKKVTIYDIADATGFSIGTVNRALSGKTRIKSETKQLILDTAEKMGYTANVAAQGLRRNPIKIGAILSCPVKEYMDDIIKGMVSSAVDLEKYNTSVDIRTIEYTDDNSYCKKVLELMDYFYEEKYNGVILFSSPKTAGISLMINKMTDEKIPIATVAEDIADSRRILHVGINATMTGSMAAELLSLCCPHGKIAILTNGENSEVNHQYIKGFKNFSENGVFADIKIYRHFDKPELVISETDRMLRENPQLDGIYITSASSSIACNRIRELGRGYIKIITTDILSDTSDFLQRGLANATMFQNPFRQGRDVVKHLYTYITKNTGSGQYLITPTVVFSSNIKDYLNN